MDAGKKKPRQGEHALQSASTPKATSPGGPNAGNAGGGPVPTPKQGNELPGQGLPPQSHRFCAYLRSRPPAFWQAIFSGLLVLNAGIQIYFVSRQLSNATTATEISRQSLVTAQRAYLSIGPIDQIDPGIKIHVTNFGHVPAKILDGTMVYMRVAYSSNIPLDRREMPIAATQVNPGAASEFTFVVDLPKLSSEDQAAVEHGGQLLVMKCDARFDTGFQQTDNLDVMLNFLPNEKRWARANEGVLVDLPKAPNTVPQAQQNQQR